MSTAIPATDRPQHTVVSAEEWGAPAAGSWKRRKRLPASVMS